MQRADAFAVWLELAELVAIEHAQAGNTVGDSAFVQLPEPGYFVGRGGHNQFAAFFVGDSVLRAEALHRGASRYTVTRLERSGAVVETGVDDAAVVSGLVGGDAVFFFDNYEALAGEAARVFKRSRKTDDSCADDEEVGLAISHSGSASGTPDYTNVTGARTVIAGTSEADSEEYAFLAGRRLEGEICGSW
jgi:hypothetical protein